MRRTKIRLNLELTPALSDRLDYLTEASGAHSRTEVIRRALSLYDILISRASAEKTLLLRYPNGKEEVLLFIP
jgi:metal-responsive CopG/Arc/MetJ family transcriptional regulator